MRGGCYKAGPPMWSRTYNLGRPQCTSVQVAYLLFLLTLSTHLHPRCWIHAAAVSGLEEEGGPDGEGSTELEISSGKVWKRMVWKWGQKVVRGPFELVLVLKVYSHGRGMVFERSRLSQWELVLKQWGREGLLGINHTVFWGEIIYPHFTSYFKRNTRQGEIFSVRTKP